MFAEPSQLGYDTTMRPVLVGTTGSSEGHHSPNATFQYDIAVRSLDGGKVTWYRTERLLANIGADAARGRGTRVWEVRRLDMAGNPVGPSRVLKDCWVDDDRKREGTTLAEIRASAETEEHKKAFTEHFLTVECHGDVYIGNEEDNTHSLHRRNQTVPQDLDLYQLQLPPPKSSTADQFYRAGAFPQFNTVYDSIVAYGNKSHYRIVFEELGTTIDKLTSAFDILKVLSIALFSASSQILRLQVSLIYLHPNQVSQHCMNAAGFIAISAWAIF